MYKLFRPDVVIKEEHDVGSIVLVCQRLGVSGPDRLLEPVYSLHEVLLVPEMNPEYRVERVRVQRNRLAWIAAIERHAHVAIWQVVDTPPHVLEYQIRSSSHYMVYKRFRKQYRRRWPLGFQRGEIDAT